MRVPLVDLAAQSAEILEEVEPTLHDVLSRGAFIGGPAVAEFEQAYADYVGVAHCIGVGNGTDALELALRAAGVGPGAEVLMPANTFVATAEAASRIGARPILVDVDPDYLLIDPMLVENAITPRTRAIVPVHLFGQTAPMGPLLQIAEAAGVPVIEDAAQSQGATQLCRPAGSFGLAAGTSFYPGKNLGAAGDAGAVLTNDAELADRVRVMAAHGSARKYVHDVIGLNSRLDAVQAVVLSAKLRRLDRWNTMRREAAERYTDLLRDVPGVRVPRAHSDNKDVWHLFVVQVGSARPGARRAERGWRRCRYPLPDPCAPDGGLRRPRVGPGATFRLLKRPPNGILSLPIYPHISAEQQVDVVGVLAGSAPTP